jgi:hypothetical protein
VQFLYKSDDYKQSYERNTEQTKNDAVEEAKPKRKGVSGVWIYLKNNSKSTHIIIIKTLEPAAQT